MIPEKIQVELLLVTRSAFSQKLFFQKQPNSKNNPGIEKPGKAFRNGLLIELLPASRSYHLISSKSFIWQMIARLAPLDIDLEALPVDLEPNFSINTDLFLATTIMN